eukprot:scaffold17914_cov31-Tisochrysis_lutea.AAC.2
MESTNSRARSVLPLAVLSTAAPGRTCTDDSGDFSSTTPPLASNRAQAKATNLSGRTPTFSTSLSHTSSPPGKPQRTGLNSMPMTSSTSSMESTPAFTSSITSFRDAFQSCSRPRSWPASRTATRSPRSASAVASRMPIFPPATTTSYSAVSGGASGSSKTTSRGGGRLPERRLVQALSSCSSDSYVLWPPAPPVCASAGMRDISVCVSPGSSLIRGCATRLPPRGTCSAAAPPRAHHTRRLRIGRGGGGEGRHRGNKKGRRRFYFSRYECITLVLSAAQSPRPRSFVCSMVRPFELL